jgi:hypothetical protein
MTGLWLIAAAVGLVAGVVVARRFTRKVRETLAPLELPYVRKITHAGIEPGVYRVTLVLHGTERPLDFESLAADRMDVWRLGLVMPDGFVERAAPDQEEESERIRWVPSTPIVLTPGQPLDLVFRFDARANATAYVTAGFHARRGFGGMAVPCNIPVGLRDPLGIEASNLRSELYTRARDAGVLPRELPEWRRLVDLETRLRERGDLDESSPIT